MEIVLEVDRLAAGGEGVGRLPDGRVVFVPFAAPGDRLRVRIVEERRRFARGEIAEVLAPSPKRTSPRCAAFGICGGCSWQHIDYSEQIEAKRSILSDALRRIGGLRDLPEIDFVPSPAAYGYRSRTRLQRVGSGFGYRRRRSHEIEVVESCPVLTEPLEALLRAEAQPEPGPQGEWELAVGDGPARAVSLARAEGATIELPAGSDRIAVSPGVFFQANALLRGRLVEDLVREVSRERRGAPRGVLLELFAGAGFFTLPLARHFERVVAVESHPRAVQDLSRNADRAGLDHVEVVRSRVEDAIANQASQALDTIVLDPPRSGLERETSEALAGLGANVLLYVSCDPATLARDAARIVDLGYRVTAVTGYDLFPQTPHVEALVCFASDRPAAGRRGAGPNVRA